ncbi:MAG TPA: hypothetical protein VLH08_09515 [Acidobacteriota bacterium]|nr:hypothetical protein [Acidobacteriota bacterium]
MRLQDLFSRIPEPTTSSPDVNNTPTNPEPAIVPEQSVGIASNSDQFESFKPGVLDELITAKETQIPESKIYSSQYSEEELMKMEADKQQQLAKSAAAKQRKAIEIAPEEIFERDRTTLNEAFGPEKETAETVPGQIWRATINENTLIPPSPEKTFRSNLEYYMTNLAYDKNKYYSALKQMYGENFDVSKAEDLRQRTLNGDFSWLPKIEAKSDTDLKGHFAAVDPTTNVIYVNESKKQPVLGSGSNSFMDRMYSNAYGQAIWSAMRRELDPADANNMEGRKWGTIYVENKPRNVEWIDVANPFPSIGNIIRA